ncbi:ferrochelatase [Aeromonas sobria]|uniref:ferrochelatase n=1 Tax=Aeromonas sobria TaxID=646 RepID=UPI003D005E61
MTTKTGILLVNLGTPAAPTAAAVRAFLGEFLRDPRVVELPRLLWLPLLKGVILPFRAPRVAKLYRQIWTEQGSPLLAISQGQRMALEQELKREGVDVPVELAMTYGSPSLEEGWQALKGQGVNRVILLPLYPQYAASTTAAVFDGWARVMRAERHLPVMRLIRDYHAHPEYIQALAMSVRRHWEQHGQGELLLMSFHGIPQRCEDEGDPYGHQCRRTASLLAEALGLSASQWRASFQSRFGKQEWLKPYTDATIAELAQQGVKRLDVICPAFSADCLETLEEIQVENREVFMAAGGEQFEYVPALNCDQAHIRMMVSLICRELA